MAPALALDLVRREGLCDERAPVIAAQCACEKVDRMAAVVGDFITALAAFVAVLVPLLSFMSMRERRRGRHQVNR